MVTWSVSPSPFRIAFASGTTPVATEADLSGGPGGRLSYRLADASFHALTDLLSTTPVSGGDQYRVATDETGRTATVDVVRTATGARVSLAFAPATGVVETFDAFSATSGEHFLGGGERPLPLDLRGQAVAVKVAYACQNLMPSPFFLSSSGYGLSIRSSAIAAFEFPGGHAGNACAGGAEPRCPLTDGLDVAQLCVKSNALSYDVFTGTPEQIVSAYTQTVGRAAVPPSSQFALIKWRDSVTGPAQLYEDVDKLRALKIPIGWVLLDNPWETAACYGTMTFDAQKFPDPAGVIAALHARSVKLMLWISPLVRLQSCPPSSQYNQSSLFGDGVASTIDLTNQAVLSRFESNLRALIAMGVDGFKADRADEIDLEALQLTGGSGVEFQNRYPLLYAQAVAAAVRAAGKTATFATIFRAAAPGSAAVAPGFWAGDQPGTFLGLAEAIRDGLSAGVSGFPIWGSDTGGYDSTSLTREVFVRWAQFSAISPIFEVGGIGTNATFWNFGTQAVAAFRQAAVLHYELFPYLYALAGIAHASGLPILRPLALEYPNDDNAWRNDLEVLVGRDLLAAPVTVTGTQPQVYLPSGSWLDLATGETRRGGGDPSTRPTPLAELPLYLRAGAAIPFTARMPLLWSKAWPTDALRVKGRGGWLYAPAQGATRSATSDFGVFRAAVRGKNVTLTLRDAPRQTQVLVAGQGTAVSVQIDGRAVKRSSSVTALRRATSGWALSSSPFPGVVLKLAPHSGSARVVLVLDHSA